VLSLVRESVSKSGAGNLREMKDISEYRQRKPGATPAGGSTSVCAAAGHKRIRFFSVKFRDSQGWTDGQNLTG
jgi:hypothetical protein